jgi:hypothetical protein
VSGSLVQASMDSRPVRPSWVGDRGALSILGGMGPDRITSRSHASDCRSADRVSALNREATGRGIREDLHICPQCSSRMVQPVEWAPVDMRRWRVELRCPECEWESSGVYPQHILDRYDTMLDEGAASLIEDLTTLERSNLEEEIDRFVGAIDSDQILPEDF